MSKASINRFINCIKLLGYDEEYEELKDLISKEKFENYEKSGVTGLNYMLRIICIALPMTIAAELFSQGVSEEVIRIGIGKFILGLAAILGLVVIKYKREKLKYFLPLKIVLFISIATFGTLEIKEYRMIEYFFPAMAGVCVGASINPTQWKLNFAAFTSAVVFADVKISTSYNNVSSDLHIAFVCSVVFFLWFSFLESSRVKLLFKMLIENEYLVREIIKIIKAFPHAVLIQSERECFTNQEFESEIKEIDSRFHKLKNVFIRIQKEDEYVGEVGEAGIKNADLNNLKQLLKRQVARLKFEDIVEQDAVFIKFSEVIKKHSAGIDVSVTQKPFIEKNFNAHQFDRDEDSESVEPSKGRYFNIKTMRVLWKGKQSFMHVFIDITDILRLEEANNNIKGQKIMFASASHEFRTPLNSIINSGKFVLNSFGTLGELISSTNILRKDKNRFDLISEKAKKFLKIGVTSSELLMALIEDILNLSKIESNIFTVCKSEFDIGELIEEVVSLFKYQGEAKKLVLIIDIERDLRDKKIYSDRCRIKQTLINLIGNSYKFTFEGSIKVIVKSRRLENSNAVEFTVADTGIGVRKEDQKKLFKLFGMLDTSKSINPNGGGIGLTVSRKYIELLGGSIHLESEEEKGTKMTFIIPEEKMPKEKVEEIKDHRIKNHKNISVLSKFEKQVDIFHVDDANNIGIFESMSYFPTVREITNRDIGSIDERFTTENFINATKEIRWR